MVETDIYSDNNGYFSEHLAKYLKVLAEFGEVAIVCDHKFINKKQGDDSPKALGISALITDAYGVQTDILLAYIPVNSSTNLFTVPLLEEVLMEFQLWDSFRNPRLHLVSITLCQ